MVTGSHAAAQDAPARQDPSPSTVSSPDDSHDSHDMHDMAMDMSMDTSGHRWQLMQDGNLYVLFNKQGGPRGGRDLRAPNWWMGMAAHRLGAGQLTLTSMFSLDPATVGRRGYHELFQVGEALDGKPLVDRQHPHDFFMQLSAAWRVPLGADATLTLAGGPVGEPALGPVAFMHRASASGIALAPLGHHTFDSTHVSFGVVTMAVDRGPITVEGSVFNGREPDQNRWNFDFGRLDSVSARVWYRPSPRWAFQASAGRLVRPEQLEPGNIVRTTASASYLSAQPSRFVAATVGVGMNVTDAATRHAAFGEFARGWGATLLSARLEVVQVETELLTTDMLPTTASGEARRDPVTAWTVGIQRDVGRWRRLVAAVGANATLYGVPSALRATHGAQPASFQIFLQLRPAPGAMGRMWDMRMGGPPMPMPMPMPTSMPAGLNPSSSGTVQ